MLTATHAHSCSEWGSNEGITHGSSGAGGRGAAGHVSVCHAYPPCCPRVPSTPFQLRGAIPAAPGAQGLRGPEPGSARGKEAARRLGLSVPLLSARAIWSQSYGHLVCWGDGDAVVSTGHKAPTCRGGHGGAEEGLEAGGAELADRPHAAQRRLPRGRQRADGHRTAAAAPCSRGCPGCPRSSWSRGRRLWQREAPAAGAHAPAPANPAPCRHGGCWCSWAPAGGSKPLGGRRVGKFPTAPPASGCLPPASPGPWAPDGGVFLERFYPSVLEL